MAAKKKLAPAAPPQTLSPEEARARQLAAMQAQVKAVQRRRAALISKDSLLEFTRFTMPDPEDVDDATKSLYEVNWHHEAIAELLQKLEKGLVHRVIITMPPRSGKSELVSRRFIPWLIGRDPYRQTIFATYGADFAEDFGRKARDIINTPAYRQVFPRVSLQKASRASDRMETEAGGMMVWCGVGGPITGRGAHVLIIDDPCVARGQRVRTKRGLVPIENVVVGDDVLTHKSRWRKVTAVFDNGVKEIVELSAGSSKLLLTPTHLVYTSDGWIEARHAKDVYAEDVSSVWCGVRFASPPTAVLQRSLLGCIAALAAEKLPVLQAALSAAQGFGAEVLRRVLRVWKSGDSAPEKMHWVRDRVHGRECAGEVLLSEVSARDVAEREKRAPRSSASRATREAPGSSRHGDAAMRCVLDFVRTVAHLPAVLLNRLQELGALVSHEKGRQLEFSSWYGGGLVSSGVQALDFRAGTRSIQEVHGVRRGEYAWRAPHGREQDERRDHESGVPVRLVPHAVAQVEGRGFARVHDLEVEEDHSFVAEGVVVHNCKNREEAESITNRDKVWNWFTSTAYTRLMPGGVIALVSTRWHEDDIVGRIYNTDYVPKEEADKWFRLDLPAIIEEGGENERALWPERYPLEVLKSTRAFIGERDWNALYQQRPTPPEGVFYKQSMIHTYDQAEYERVLKNCRRYLAGDLALGDTKKHDASCVGAALVDEHDTIYISPDLYWDRKKADASVEKIIDMMVEHEPMATWWEKGQIEKAVGPFLFKRMSERKVYSNVEAMPVAGDKGARSSAIRGRMAMAKVKFPKFAPWFPRAKEQMLKFTGNGDDAEDDFCDFIALIGQGLSKQLKAGKLGSNVIALPTVGTLGWVKHAAKMEARERERLKKRAGF